MPLKCSFKRLPPGSGKVAQWLGEFAALLGDVSSGPGTHTRWSQQAGTLASGRQMSSLASLGTCAHVVYTHTDTHTNKNRSFCLKQSCYKILFLRQNFSV